MRWMVRPDVSYHIDLCEQAGFMTVQRTSGVSYPISLTWQGHQELARLRTLP